MSNLFGKEVSENFEGTMVAEPEMTVNVGEQIPMHNMAHFTCEINDYPYAEDSWEGSNYQVFYFDYNQNVLYTDIITSSRQNFGGSVIPGVETPVLLKMTKDSKGYGQHLWKITEKYRKEILNMDNRWNTFLRRLKHFLSGKPREMMPSMAGTGGYEPVFSKPGEEPTAKISTDLPENKGRAPDIDPYDGAEVAKHYKAFEEEE